MFTWNPIKTSEQLPEDGQRVFYFFYPSGYWHIGDFDKETMSFHGRSGFCDRHDAPFWHPEPPKPEYTEDDYYKS